MDYVEYAEQVLLARHEHLPLEGVAPERWVVGQGELQRRLERHEHYHEVDGLARRFYVAAVVLACQLCHVLAHALYVFLQVAVFLLGRGGVDIALVGHERHLRVYYRVLALRVVQYDVGLHLAPRLVVLQRAAVVVAQARLHFVVYAFGQPLRCEQVAQYYLAHVPGGLVVAPEHVGQALGLLAYGAAAFHHHLYLLAQRGGVAL